MPRLLFTASLLLSASVAFGGEAAPCSCLGDLNDDHQIDAADLALLLGDWGTGFTADLDNNNTVDAADLAILLGGWGPCSAPANDQCGNATPIALGSTWFGTAGADTTDLPQFVGGPGDCAGFIWHDVWYRFNAPLTGTLHVTTCNAPTFDTQIALYGSIIPGNCVCPVNGIGLSTVVACGDDTYDPFELCTTFDADVVAGSCYYLRVGGFAPSQQGTGVIELSYLSVGNDCSHPIETPNSLNITVTGTTADNGDDQLDTSCVDGDTTAEWIKFTGPCGSFTNTTTITTCHPETDYDTTIRVFEITGAECPGTEIACNDDSPAPGCQIGRLNRKSKVSFTSIQNATYLVRVGGFQGATGNYKLTINTSCP